MEDDLINKIKPFKEDLRFLGTILGDILKEQEGEDLFATVEKIRKLSKQSRSNNNVEVTNELKKLIKGLNEKETLLLSRAFSQFLNLANIAEAHQFINQLRNNDEEAIIGQHSSLTKLIPRLLEKGHSADKVYETVVSMEIDLVLTAHPTEVKRRTLLQKYHQIADILQERSHVNLTPYENKLREQELKQLISTIWQTDEIRRTRPTPVEEARWGLAIIEDTLWDAVPTYIRSLDNIIEKNCQRKLPLDCCPIIISSWMGGDRDGNPNVTHKVTREVCYLSRWMAAELYAKEVDNIIQSLSLDECNAQLRDLVGEVREPYRVLLRQLRDKMQRTRDWYGSNIDSVQAQANNIYTDIEEFTESLKICYQSLIDCNAATLANGDLLDLIRRTVCFGLYFMRLDIRQESTQHENVINSITEHLGLGSYKDWSEEEKQKFLVKECSSKRPLLPHEIKLPDNEQEVLDTFFVCSQLPVDSLGAYVISMASSPSDVLEVCLLQKIANIKTPLRVVPLFETLDDLSNAPEIIDDLFNINWYLNSIDGKQEVMIGYSDSGKDAGKLASSWAQYKALKQLFVVSEKYKVNLNLFHGKGGSIGRGGGPIDSALLAQPPYTVNNYLRLTEQGEVIQQKFSMPDIALHHFMQYTTAILEATLEPPPVAKESWCERMDEMAAVACSAYRAVVRDDEDFVKYFHRVTPEAMLGKLHIGSRPAKRRKEGGIESLRAIPWVFAWTQTRLLLPAWLGTEEALHKVKNEYGIEVIEEMTRQWPFFYLFTDMLDMVLSKTDQFIVAYYEECLADEELKKVGNRLRGCLNKAKEISNQINQSVEISEDKALSRNSIKHRNIYADPLNLLQAECLRRIKEQQYEDLALLEETVMVTIAGIAAAMKNTG